jgi:hypothetical protein
MTLVEVLVAMSLLALTSLVVASLFPVLMRGIRQSRHRVAATAMACDASEKAYLNYFKETGLTLDGEKIVDGEAYQVTFTETSADESRVVYLVTVAWKEPWGPQQLQLESIWANYAEE